MTFPNSTAQTQSNTNHKTAETVAERHREAYTRSTQSTRPLSALWVKLRPWAIGAAVGAVLSAAAAFAVSYQVMPARATHVENVFTTIDGHPALILSGDVVFDSGPLALSPSPTQQVTQP
jgi:hypothetical protein